MDVSLTESGRPWGASKREDPEENGEGVEHTKFSPDRSL